jgi:predicted helicase
MSKPSHPKAQHYVNTPLFKGLRDFQTLESRIEKLPTKKERGDAFEVFAEAYCATNKKEAAKYVYAHKIPIKIRKKLRIPAKDYGLDGVIEKQSGTLRGYQVKFRSGRKNLTWREVSTFFGLSERCDERLLIFCFIQFSLTGFNVTDILSKVRRCL